MQTTARIMKACCLQRHIQTIWETGLACLPKSEGSGESNIQYISALRDDLMVSSHPSSSQHDFLQTFWTGLSPRSKNGDHFSVDNRQESSRCFCCQDVHAYDSLEITLTISFENIALI